MDRYRDLCEVRKTNVRELRQNNVRKMRAVAVRNIAISHSDVMSEDVAT